MAEKMNKSQRTRRKITDETSTISRTNLKFMKIFYRFHGFFVFVTQAVNIFVFCYIYKN